MGWTCYWPCYDDDILYILIYSERLWSSFIILPIIRVWKSHSFKTLPKLCCLHLRPVQTCLAETLPHINLLLCRLWERQMSSEHNGVESHSDILNHMGVYSWTFRSAGEGKEGKKVKCLQTVRHVSTVYFICSYNSQLIDCGHAMRHSTAD